MSRRKKKHSCRTRENDRDVETKGNNSFEGRTEGDVLRFPNSERLPGCKIKKGPNGLCGLFTVWSFPVLFLDPLVTSRFHAPIKDPLVEALTNFWRRLVIRKVEDIRIPGRCPAFSKVPVDTRHVGFVPVTAARAPG